MKKITKWLAVMFSVVLCTFCFSSCLIPLFDSIEVRAPMETIEKVEIIYSLDLARPTEEGWEQYQREQNEWILLEPEHIADIAETDYAAFIADLEDLPYRGWILLGAAVDPSFSFHGYIVVIHTAEGEEYYASSGGGSLTSCKEDVWRACLQKYVGVPLNNPSLR